MKGLFKDPKNALRVGQEVRYFVDTDWNPTLRKGATYICHIDSFDAEEPFGVWIRTGAGRTWLVSRDNITPTEREP